MSRRPRQVVATSLLSVLGAVIGLGACGSSTKPPLSAVENKLMTVSQFKVLNTKQLDCVAGVLRTYGQAKSLTDWVNGKIPASQLQGSNSSAVKTDTENCVTKNAGG
ncbi:MAG: hypothetical protein ACYC1D_12070 [Acidimicrobiales bacterium]